MQAMPVRERLKGLRIATPSPQVDAQNGAGLASDRLFTGLRVQVVCPCVDVAEDGLQSLPANHVGRRDECKGRNQHLAGKTQCRDQQLQPQRGVCDEHAFRRAKPLGYARFELANQRAVVAESTGVENAIQMALKYAPVRNYGSTDYTRCSEKTGNERRPGGRCALSRH